MKKAVSFVKTHKFLTGAAAVVTFIFVIALIHNFWTQFASDDWCYMFVYDHFGNPNENSRRVRNIFDVIVSMKNHWQICNGRVVAHGLLQLVLTTSYPHFHKIVFNFVNAFMYVLLGLVIYRHATYKKRDSVLLLAGIYIMMWFFLPQYGVTVMWASAAANYCWCTVITLAYLLPYRMYAVNSGAVMKDSVKNAVVMGILGLFSGCTNENSGGALALMCILFVLYYKLRGIKIPKWSVSGIIGVIIGAIVMISAPGNYRISSKADFAELMNRLQNVIDISKQLLFGLLIIMCVILLLVWITNRGKYTDETEKEHISDCFPAVIYIIGAAASIFVLIFAAMRPERTWFIGVCLLMITIGYFYMEIKFQSLPKYLPHVCAAALAVVFTVSLYSELSQIHVTHVKGQAQRAAILTALDEGKTEATIQHYLHSECKHDAAARFYFVSYFNTSPDDWVNAWAAKYYGLDKIYGE